MEGKGEAVVGVRRRPTAVVVSLDGAGAVGWLSSLLAEGRAEVSGVVGSGEDTVVGVDEAWRWPEKAWAAAAETTPVMPTAPTATQRVTRPTRATAASRAATGLRRRCCTVVLSDRYLKVA